MSEVESLRAENGRLKAGLQRATRNERKWRDQYHRLAQSLARAVVDLELVDVEETRDGAHVTFAFAREELIRD